LWRRRAHRLRRRQSGTFQAAVEARADLAARLGPELDDLALVNAAMRVMGERRAEDRRSGPLLAEALTRAEARFAPPDALPARQHLTHSASWRIWPAPCHSRHAATTSRPDCPCWYNPP